MVLSGSSGGVGGVIVGATLADAGDADGLGAAGACVGDGVGASASANVFVGLAITSLPLLMGRGGGAVMLLPLKMPGVRAELLLHT
jgi:hypothetical protein